MSKLMDTAKILSLKKIFAAVIAVVLVLTLFSSTVLADVPNQYDVTILDAGDEITVTTTETQPTTILKSAGISVNDKDKIDISGFSEGEGGEIVISRLNSVNVDFENHIQNYNVYSSTVGEALNEIGLTLKKNDKLNYAASSKIKNGMVIKIKEAFSSSVSVDGKTIKYAVTEGTVADLLKVANIKLSGEDFTEPSIDKSLKKNMKVKVFRVVYKKETKNETIKFSTKEIKDKTLNEGKKKVTTKGQNGSKKVTYEVKYVNGKAQGKQKLSETVTKKAVTKVVKIGTKKVSNIKPNGVQSKNGFTLGQVIQGRYTHYCACATCNGNSRGITTSGKRIRNGMSNPYFIACNWLPLGSVIKTKGHYYTVVDRGGSGLSRTGRIDIFTPEGHSACYRYGTGSCKIEIVRLGW